MRRSIAALLLLLSHLLCASGAHAATAAAASGPESAPPRSLFRSTTDSSEGITHGGMVVAALVALGAGALAMRHLRVKSSKQTTKSCIHVHGVKPLGPKTMLYAVDFCGERLLISTGPDGAVRCMTRVSPDNPAPTK